MDVKCVKVGNRSLVSLCFPPTWGQTPVDVPMEAFHFSKTRFAAQVLERQQKVFEQGEQGLANKKLFAGAREALDAWNGCFELFPALHLHLPLSFAHR